MKKIVLAVLAALSTGNACALSLEEAIGEVIESHPRVLAAQHALAATGYDLEAARGARRPKLALQADPGKTLSSSAGFQGKRAGGVAIKGSVMLYDGGRSEGEIGNRQARQDAARFKLEATRNALAVQVSDAYLDVIKRRALLQIAQENEAQHRTFAQMVEQIAQVDKGRASEAIQARARLGQAEVVRATYQGNLEESEGVLSELLYFVAHQELDPPEEIGIPVFRHDANEALLSHPSWRAARAEIQGARAQAQVAGAWSRPRVELLATASNATDIGGQYHALGNRDVRLGLSWDAVDGGIGRAQERSALAAVEAAEQNARAVMRDLSNELGRAWSQYAARLARSSQTANLSEQATAVRDAYLEQFKAGRRSILELLNAENERFSARVTAVSEMWERVQYGYRVMGAMGQLLQEGVQ